MAEAAVPARAALAGNPSDGYGGAVLAVTVPQLSATVHVSRGPRLEVEPHLELVVAAARRFAREYVPAAEHSVIRWCTSIPRGVGLGGSSALVIATLRALCEVYREQPLPEDELAHCALAVEVEDMKIEAGLQDRVAQSYGGLTFMDFGAPRRYERLDPALLPPLALAWREAAGADSGIVHGDLRARHDRGEETVVEAMQALARFAHRARHALLMGDRAMFMRCLDGSFEVRRSVMTLDPRHTEMVALARRSAAAANYTGSGGAVVAACRDHVHRGEVISALREGACSVLALDPS